MTKVESLRNELHKKIESGTFEEILVISKKLDEEILKIMKAKIKYPIIKRNISSVWLSP